MPRAECYYTQTERGEPYAGDRRPAQTPAARTHALGEEICNIVGCRLTVADLTGYMMSFDVSGLRSKVPANCRFLPENRSNS